MSYTLWVFKGPVPASEQDFVDRLGRFDAGDEATFDASTEVAAFYDELCDAQAQRTAPDP